MMRSAQIAPDFSPGRLVRIFLYTFIAMLLQAHLVARLPYQAFRIDLFIPVMFAVAIEWPPFAGLVWASVWGYMIDNFSGEFWGLHVASYMVTICLVNMASDRFDCQNPVYQMGLVGMCALGQSVALGLFISFVPMDLQSLTSTWISLGIRTLLSMTVAPFVIYPILKPKNLF